MNNLSHVGPTEWSPDTLLPRSRTLPDLLDEMAGSSTEETLALVAGQDRLTYRELAERTIAAAGALSLLGVKQGSRVAMLESNTSHWHEISFGVLRRGAQLEAFNTWVRAYDLEHLLGASQAEVLIIRSTVGTTDLLAELRKIVPELWETSQREIQNIKFPNLRSVVVLGENPFPSIFYSWKDLLGLWENRANKKDNAALPDIERNLSRPDDVAMVLYTSGSTKYPKAVPMLHSTMIENAFGIGERMGLTKDDRVWLGSPLFWSFGIANAAMATMSHGACLVLQERFSPEEAALLLANERCTAAYLLPGIVEALASKAGAAIRAIQTLRTGLTIGRPDEIRRVVDELGIEDICNIYGSTETYGNCCVTPYWLPLDERLETQGEPLPGVEIRITDQISGVVVPLGDTGEIQVRGHVMPGYVGDPSLTSEVFTQDGWYRTGDTGVLRKDGRLRFLARDNDMIKSSGINISPAEVEGFLSQHPAIMEVAVVGAPHPTKDQIVVAFFTTSSPELTGEAVIEYFKGKVASYKIPAIAKVVSAMPRTSTGKLDRKELVIQAAHITDAFSL